MITFFAPAKLAALRSAIAVLERVEWWTAETGRIAYAAEWQLCRLVTRLRRMDEERWMP